MRGCGAHLKWRWGAPETVGARAPGQAQMHGSQRVAFR